MKTLMFVLVGLSRNNSEPDYVSLKNQIEESLEAKGINLPLKLKQGLISSRMEGVAFYCSLIKHKDEVKDWIHMARNFELTLNKRPISKIDLLKQYTRLAKKNNNLYKPVHFTIAETLFDELENVGDVVVYAFH